MALAAAAAFAACSGTGRVPAKAADAGKAFEDGVSWDAEYDVVVVGFGAAGASTAITAADKGAKVLLLEKAPEGEAGGNSAICMQWICETKDPAATLEYFKGLRGAFKTPSDSMLKTYVDEISKNYEWFVSLGAPNAKYFDYAEFPELKGSSSFTPFTVNGNTGMSPTAFGGDGAAYKLLKANVVKRADRIDVWYEAPAIRLVQDPATRIVHGAVAAVGGRQVKVRAKDGVVLCCGGFENSPEMQQNYTQRLFWPPTGNAHYNTGDGIKMALEAGADLWHMSNVVTNIEFYDEANKSSTFAFQGTSAGIMVGADGTRFMDETAKLRHGKMFNHGNYANAYLPDTIYSIFDQTAMDKGKLHFTWSKDGKEELAKGWIKAAPSIPELAALIGVDPARLSESVATYNGFCAAGKDLAFGRKSKLNAIESGPFYAIKITPAMGNTQGGPVRNERGEVLDPAGAPIPHLYEAGELGDIWSNCYQASCNFGGGAAFGRISGANAALPKEDNARRSVMAGRKPFAPAVAASKIVLAEGELLGEGQGKGGTPVVVKVSMAGGKIAKVEVVSHSETPGISEPALKAIPAAIVKAGSPEVDIVTGATLTSKGIIAAVKDALSKAK